MTIHSSHPFAEPMDPQRQFRGRLGGAVTLWTAGSGSARAGLTVSSVMVGLGERGSVLALLDPDAALSEALRDTGTAVVHLLRHEDIDLADAFAGTVPAPGGPFRLRDWEQSDHGPVLAGHHRVHVSLESERQVGWSVLVETAIIETVIVAGTDQEPGSVLEHRRGRYHRGHD